MGIDWTSLSARDNLPEGREAVTMCTQACMLRTLVHMGSLSRHSLSNQGFAPCLQAQVLFTLMDMSVCTSLTQAL